jgi:Flp pilus assembly pilin Flp
MKRLQNLEQLNKRLGAETGQTMSEYGVTLLVLSAATVAAFGALSNGVANLVNSVVGLLP